MKRSILVLSIVTTCAVSALLYAVEKKPIAQVDSSALIKEVNVAVADPDLRGTSMAFWLPHELWQLICTANPNISLSGGNAILKAYEGICIVAVLRGFADDDSTPVFIGEKEVAESLTVTYISPEGTKHILQPLAEQSPILKEMLSITTPLFSSTFGAMGKHIWFFTYSNVGPNGQRIVSPYKKGRLQFDLAQTGKLPAVKLELDTLLNALHIPRVCATCDEPMHITWNYCPWCGKKLSE